MNEIKKDKIIWPYHQLNFYLKELNISSQLITQISDLFQVKTINKDDYFSTQGKTTDRIGFVCTGCFVMYTSNMRGDMDVKEFIGSNNFILSTWNTSLSLATIQALTDAVILEARYSEVKKIYATDARLDETAKMGAEKRMNAICEQLNHLKNKTAKERYLLFKEKYSNLEKDIPQYLVASFLGITPTQLSRIRKNLA